MKGNQCISLKKPKTPQRKAVREERRENKATDIQKTNEQMAIVSPSLLVFTLNVKGLSSPIKRHSLAEWIKKTKQKISSQQLYT